MSGQRRRFAGPRAVDPSLGESHMNEIPLTIADAAASLRSGALSSVELTSICLDRADVLDAKLGTYLERFDEAAMAAAARADAEFAAGIDRGPMQGIPVGVKDIVASAEGPTTANSLVLDPEMGSGEGRARDPSGEECRRRDHRQARPERVRDRSPGPDEAVPHPSQPVEPDRHSGPGQARERRMVSRPACSSAASVPTPAGAFGSRPHSVGCRASSRRSAVCRSPASSRLRTASTMSVRWLAVRRIAQPCWR